MGASGKTTFGGTVKADVTSARDATGAISGECPSANERLRATYDRMHLDGPESWFDSGKLEQDLIVEMGEPWDEKVVLEVGCGEGALLNRLYTLGATVYGVDYSEAAINTARHRFPGIAEYFNACDYKDTPYISPDVVVMQGVLEHFDEPFAALEWMLDTWEPTA